MAVIPRRLTDQDLAQGKGAIGFSYDPERFVEVPSGVSGPIDAVVKGFTEAGYLAIRIPGGLAEAVGGPARPQ